VQSHQEAEVRIQDAARQLGLSDETIYRAVREGMPHARYGRLIRVQMSEVRAWLGRRFGGPSIDASLDGGTAR